MRAYLADKTGLNASGFTTRLVDAIPKSEAGKTLYQELKKYDD